MSLGRLWFYPHCSHWLFQACSVCATAHVKSHAAIHQVEEDNGIYGTALKVTHPTPPPPPTHHEASISHISPNGNSRFPISCPSFLPRVLTSKWFSVRKASVKFINLQTIVEGGPWDIFVISKIRHFLFLNCDVMENCFKNHDWNVFHETRRRKNIQWRK